MKTNVSTKKPRTHEGAVASRIHSPLEELRRSVLACLLWEDTFYESGTLIADRIADLSKKVGQTDLCALAVEARTKQKLRHAPLYLLVLALGKHLSNGEVGRTIPQVIQRADEMAELLALFWKHNGNRKTPRQLKIGLANALKQFNEYELAKYDRDGAVRLRDVLFLCHPKPKDEQQAALFKKIANRELATPDTWEVALSAGADKRETFERLMAERKLGALAFLRNLRNMHQTNVPKATVRSYAAGISLERVLPFRFIAAANAVPQWSDLIEDLMLRCLQEHDRLPGKTVVLVDNSGSMYNTTISAKSDLERVDAACALAILLRSICEDCEVIGFGNSARTIETHIKGFSLRAAIKAGPGGGTDIGNAVQLAATCGYDRIVLITDEQSSAPIGKPLPGTKAYLLNVATYQNGIGYGDWTHIHGWSESVVNYMLAAERSVD